MTDTYLEAMHIAKGKHSYADMTISRDMEEDVDMASEEKDIFTKLARSIAPEIYGMIDVKKALCFSLLEDVRFRLYDHSNISLTHDQRQVPDNYRTECESEVTSTFVSWVIPEWPSLSS